MGKVIAFANQKGGVGKTTTCVNMAAYVSLLSGKKVLLIDLDPQGNASTGLGVAKTGVSSIYQIIAGTKNITDADVIQKTAIPALSVLPSNIDLAGAEVELVSLKSDREQVIKNAIAKIKDNYDYIFLDCPPSLGMLTVNALTAANEVIIPIQCEFYALEGLSQLLNTIKLIKQHLNLKLDVNGVVLTQYNGRSHLAQQVAHEVTNYFAERVYQSFIPRNVALAEAPSYGQPIAVYRDSCQGAKAYKSLAAEFLLRERGDV